jgi:hypothetical protein
MGEESAKLPALQGLRSFYLGPSSTGVAGAMIKASADVSSPSLFLEISSYHPLPRNSLNVNLI